MRSLLLGMLGGLLWSSTVTAQTAEFKCPKPGTVVEMATGERVAWLSQEARYCRRQVKSRAGEEFADNWYAPVVSIPASRSQTYAEQVKPWTLWPLSVGKKITATYDGPGSTVGFQGTWHHTITVDSYEKVTTKLGTYDVFVVTLNQEALSHRFKGTTRTWYAPALGLPVKTTITDNQGRNDTFETVRVTQ